jgi:predicted ATPase/DNA-binding winged helix-turn-helix (wHTH) protein
MLGRRCRSSAAESVKSQRNSKELSKSAGTRRRHGVSSSVPADAGAAGFSDRGDAAATVYEIGPFRLDPGAAVLTRLGMAEALGPRAVAVFTVLVQNAHQPVTKNALMDAAWPGLVVEEANLSVQISSIRRALAQVPGGERWVETLARRGYRFIGPVTELRDGLPQQTKGDRCGNLPEPLTSFIGRERELVELKRLLAKNRLLTLAGAGGIGKTRLALQLAAEVKDAYRDGVWFIDFAPLDDPALVPNVAAQTLGLQQSAGKPLIETLCRQVKGQRLLLIFDNCEHVLDASARLAEAVLRGAPEPTIIATSREPLRIGGEQIYRLPSLSLPDSAANVESIRQSDAVLLFVDRAQHQQPDFALSAALAPAVAQLCVRLDGIPFALELAAALVHVYSIDEINARLDDRFNLLLNGSRTALPRQQTLRATLDWSHGLLSEPERLVLRRVSQFLGGFTREAAMAVAIDDTINESSIADVLSQLVARSLLVAETNDVDTRYRMLETTRAYGQEKLEAAEEIATTQWRHAQHFRTLFQRAADEWLRLPEADWRSLYLPEVDNVRVALEWSLGENGDPAIAVGLAGASGPVWTSLSLYGEGVQRLEAAATRLGPKGAESDEARLWLWLGSLLEPSAPARTLACFEKAMRLYRKLDNALGLSHTRVWLARVLATLGRFEASRKVLAEVFPDLKRLRLPKLFGIHSHNAGFLAIMTGDAAAARAHYENGVAFFREAGNEFGVLACTSGVANVCWAAGDLDAAEIAFRAVIALWRKWQSGKKNALGMALANLAGVLTERGQIAEALVVAREGLPMLSDVGSAWLFIDHLALRAALAGKWARAAELAGHANAMLTVKASEREPNEARAHTRLHALLRERLDAVELEHLLAKGAKMTEVEACRMAMED